MKPPAPLQKRQGFAHLSLRRQIPFAQRAVVGDTLQSGLAAATLNPISLNCYPSPIIWPGPAWIRPFFVRAAVAGAAQFPAHVDNSQQIGFAFGAKVAMLRAIKTRTRGKNRCRSNHFSLSERPPCLWQVACKTRRHAALAVPLQVSPLRMHWTKTLLQGLQSGHWAGLLPAMHRGRLAASKATETGAFGPEHRMRGHAGLTPGMAFFHVGAAHV